MKVFKEVKHVTYENVEMQRPKTLIELQTIFCSTKLYMSFTFTLCIICIIKIGISFIIKVFKEAKHNAYENFNNKDYKSDPCGSQNNISLHETKCVIFFCSLFSI